jgi:hypothetical protein
VPCKAAIGNPLQSTNTVAAAAADGCDRGTEATTETEGLDPAADQAFS